MSSTETSQIQATSILAARPSDAQIDMSDPEAQLHDVLVDHGLVNLQGDESQTDMLVAANERARAILAMHQIAEAIDPQVHAIMDERNRLRTEVAEQMEQVRQARRAHEIFRGEVRRVALEVAAEQGWCDSGVNERLEELGLDRITRSYTVTATYELTLTIEDADNEEDAEEQANSIMEGWFYDAEDSSQLRMTVERQD